MGKLICQSSKFIIFSFMHFPNDCEKQSIVVYEFCKSFKKNDVILFECTP